ncbi:hypothetical protein DSO57_1025475 [Entomophthora muscae]|uniref:Uncharacterized protein n=1 Tax=Entomophthora muscae TaxID=34485 RepID=A0ACC2RH09_9FUNG|nr:hypothetical protein DSO57_1025475 [Entomophthora muscae]
MILPVLKFVVFSLGPFLLLLWTTSPDLWSCISSSACLVGDNLSSLLHLPGELFISGESVVKSLTCNDLDLHTNDYAVPAPTLEEMTVFIPPSLDGNNSVPLQAPVKLSPFPTCTPWLLTRLELIGLNAYFPQLSPVSSLWSSLQAAIPVLHWAASWWFISPGWEPNLVSLAPLSHNFPKKNYHIKRKASKHLKSAEDLNQVIDKKWVMAAPLEELIEPVRFVSENFAASKLRYFCPLHKGSQLNGHPKKPDYDIINNSAKKLIKEVKTFPANQ